jgi:RNA polymerase sigma factor (sigma-70 family)
MKLREITTIFKDINTLERLPANNIVKKLDITKKAQQTDIDPNLSYEIDFDNIDKEKLKKVVAKVIDHLPNKKDTMVLQAYFGLGKFEKNYSMKQIARALGLSTQTIRMRIYKVIKQLSQPDNSTQLKPFHEDKSKKK